LDLWWLTFDLQFSRPGTLLFFTNGIKNIDRYRGKWCDNKNIYIRIHKTMRFLAKKKVKSARGHHKREGSPPSQDGKTITVGNLAIRNCLFVKHFSLFDISTSSGDPKSKESKHAQSSYIESTHFLGQSPAQNGQPTATSWDSLFGTETSEKCYRCFCHVCLKLKSPINGPNWQLGSLIYYCPAAAC